MEAKVPVIITKNAIRQAQRRGLSPSAIEVIEMAANYGEVRRLPGGKAIRLLNSRAVAAISKDRPDLPAARLGELLGTSVVTRDLGTSYGMMRIILTALKDKRASFHQLYQGWKAHAKHRRSVTPIEVEGDFIHPEHESLLASSFHGRLDPRWSNKSPAPATTRGHLKPLNSVEHAIVYAPAV